MTRPQTRHKEKERDKDTVVAYHEYIQGQIQGELNGVAIGPGHFLCRCALALFIFGLACLLVGILVITLRHRHVYLWDWNAQFVGPFFVILFLMCCSFAVFLLTIARRRTNQYRKDLSFRPIGDYGVAVVHKSKLSFDEKQKAELRSGTTPHNVRHPGRPGVNDRGNRGGYSRSGYDNRGYKNDQNGDDYYNRRPRRDDRPDRGDRPPRDDRRRDEDRRRYEEDRRRRDDRGDRPPRDDEKRRPPDDDRRRDDAARRRYEDDKRRRYEEDRRRAMARKQAEAEGRPLNGEERGVDVVAPRGVQITTKVRVTEEYADESDL